MHLRVSAPPEQFGTSSAFNQIIITLTNNKQLIFGRHPVIDALKDGKEFDRIYLQQGTHGEFERDVRKLCKEHDIPMQVIPKERMSRFTGKNHQGVIGFLSLLPYYRVEDVLPMIYEKGENPLFLLLDGVTDVRNFGAIARSAEIMGAHALVIPHKGAAQINADALKTSAGALTKLPVCREKSLVSTIQWLKMNGISVFASDLKAADPITDLDLTGPVALIIGSEREGVSSHVVREAHGNFIIPQRGTGDSFNVSVATGIALYEVDRQRRLQQG